MNIKFIFLSSRQFLNFDPGSCKQERWQSTHCPSWELEEFLRFLTSATEIQKQVNEWAFSYSCSQILGRRFLSHKLNIKGQEYSMRKALIYLLTDLVFELARARTRCVYHNRLMKILPVKTILRQKFPRRTNSGYPLLEKWFTTCYSRLPGASVYHDQILLLPFVRCLFKYFHRYFCY